jgi:hypothetical protein
MSKFNKLNIGDDPMLLHLIRNTDILSIFLHDSKSKYDLLRFLDFASDYISEYSPIIKSYNAYGASGDFSVDIHEYQGIYWVFAPEFDNRGLFLSLKCAEDAAFDIYSNFQPDDE